MENWENLPGGLLAGIGALDAGAMARARERQRALCKPPGSLGRLEALAVQLAGITGRVYNRVDRPLLLVFAADNGVTAEGVSVAPRAVTRRQAVNITRGLTGAAVLARVCGCAVTVVDMGTDGPPLGGEILHRSLGPGTRNITLGPAMTRAQALAGIETGFSLARDAAADAIGVGELGIGNTTTSAAVLAALLGAAPEAVTGRGGGLTDEGLLRKREAVRRALAVNAPDPGDVIGVLAAVGGFDLAAMCGAFLGAAAARRPAVIDGLISAVAALCACRLCPEAREYLVPSHASREPGFTLAMEELALRPLLTLDMALGEGSGCPLAFRLLSASCALMNDMGTFAEAGIDDSYLAAIDGEDNE